MISSFGIARTSQRAITPAFPRREVAAKGRRRQDASDGEYNHESQRRRIKRTEKKEKMKERGSPGHNSGAIIKMSIDTLLNETDEEKRRCWLIRSLVTDKSMSPYALVACDHDGNLAEFPPLPVHRMYCSYLLQDGDQKRNAFLAYGNLRAAQGVREHFRSLMEQHMMTDLRDHKNRVGKFLLIEEWDLAELARACYTNSSSILLVQGRSTSEAVPFAPPTCYCHPSPDDRTALAAFRRTLQHSFLRRTQWRSSSN